MNVTERGDMTGQTIVERKRMNEGWERGSRKPILTRKGMGQYPCPAVSLVQRGKDSPPHFSPLNAKATLHPGTIHIDTRRQRDVPGILTVKLPRTIPRELRLTRHGSRTQSLGSQQAVHAPPISFALPPNSPLCPFHPSLVPGVLLLPHNPVTDHLEPQTRHRVKSPPRRHTP